MNRSAGPSVFLSIPNCRIIVGRINAAITRMRWLDARNSSILSEKNVHVAKKDNWRVSKTAATMRRRKWYPRKNGTQGTDGTRRKMLLKFGWHSKKKWHSTENGTQRKMAPGAENFTRRKKRSPREKPKASATASQSRPARKSSKGALTLSPVINSRTIVERIGNRHCRLERQT